ncbi:hypothetical protein M409DRAFT_27869 [Zasmidium cellare ATCC 36951]|uniref:C2H2-type domain-containing protein n=1 Tax=Zasmidium cellare ATCC 36951 TaxID=1080233 RepID=A0A6A6C4G1_ZASCE|nr:uncharacterized protein M409DRAFT_27869 [Zasmidium cellare ATCC 36951]KAF2161813.1 hypothetical protein M409DRAFT_27869 [Zasmidium cellare ATCC 36951]
MSFFDMDFDGSIDPLSRDYSYDQHHDGHRWSVASSIDSPGYTPIVTSRNSSFTTINRFLQEQDAPFFSPATAFVWESNFAVNAAGHFSDNGQLRSPAYTSNASSSWSDQRDTPPVTSPGLRALSYSPSHFYNDDVVPFAFGGNPPMERRDSHSGGCCVAMHDVQKMADAQPDSDSYHFDNEPANYISYGSYAQEGYQPIVGDDSQSSTPYSGNNSDYVPQQAPQQPPQRHELASPVIRRRRAQSSRNGHSPASSARVSKRPQAGRRSSSHQNHTQSTEDDEPQCVPSSGRAFPCPLAIHGCLSSFGSKNEWKRHVTTQHMRLGFWRCDLCTNERKPNDFNRKDLFTQHVRRMHPPDSQRTTYKKSIPRSPKDPADEQYLQAAATRCYIPLRSSPEECRCIICEKVFRGHGAWDERMEHIGRHMETAKKEGEQPSDPRKWKRDEFAERWMRDHELLIVNENGGLELAP